MFSISGAIGWILLGTVVTTLTEALLTKTLINISTQFCNVIGEGIMVETSQKKKKTNDVEEAKENEEGNNEEFKEQEEDGESVYDREAAATNVSIYLSLTSGSILISSYFGGYLL